MRSTRTNRMTRPGASGSAFEGAVPAQDLEDVVDALHAFDVLLGQMDVEALVERGDQRQRAERVPAGDFLAQRARRDPARALLEHLRDPGQCVVRRHVTRSPSCDIPYCAVNPPSTARSV